MRLSFPTEKALEDYVERKIIDGGECPVCEEDVDFHLRQQRLGAYGVADIIKFFWTKKTLYVTVLELKNEPLREKDLSQLCRYLACIDRVLSRYSRYRKRFSWELYGQLAGLIDKSSDMVFMLSRMEGIEVYDISVSADHGFESSFSSECWYVNGESHKDTKPLARKVFEELFDDS